MSLRSVIDRHGTTYTVTRPGAQTNTLGRISYAAATTYTSKMYVEPATSDSLEGIDRGIQVTRELQRKHKIRIAYSLGALEERDYFIYKGETYDIILSDEFDALSGAPHYVAIAVNRIAEAQP